MDNDNKDLLGDIFDDMNKKTNTKLSCQIYLQKQVVINNNHRFLNFEEVY